MTFFDQRSDRLRPDAFEVAALVYDDGVAVDHLMCYFAEELRSQGRRIGGVVQLPPDDDMPVGMVRVLDLANGDILPIKQKLGPGSGACTLDPRALAEASLRIRRAVETGVELVFISKFSKQEMAGGGLRAEFGAAVEAGLPVLTSVKRAAVGPWLDFTGGVGTVLACRLRVLGAWWRETDQRRQALLRSRQERETVVSFPDGRVLEV